MFRLSLMVGLLSACLAALLYSPFHPTARPADYWFALPVWVIASSLTYIVLCWPSVWHEMMIHYAAGQREKTEGWKAKRERDGKSIPPPDVDVDAEAERRYRWHRFWSDCLDYASENGFHYRNNFDRLLRYEGWYGGFAVPMVKAGWLRPIAQSIRTEPMDGWTAVRMLRELAAGVPPPYPIDEPPDWKQTAAKNTEIHSETNVFASEHDK